MAKYMDIQKEIKQLQKALDSIEIVNLSSYKRMRAAIESLRKKAETTGRPIITAVQKPKPKSDYFTPKMPKRCSHCPCNEQCVMPSQYSDPCLATLWRHFIR